MVSMGRGVQLTVSGRRRIEKINFALIVLSKLDSGQRFKNVVSKRKKDKLFVAICSEV